jgi:multidrug efflux pump subunit AcrB
LASVVVILVRLLLVPVMIFFALPLAVIGAFVSLATTAARSILMTRAATILAPIPLALSSSGGLIAASLATVWEGNRPTLARTAGPPCPGPAR